MVAAIIVPIIVGVLVPLLSWLFSGSTTTVVKRATGLADLDDVHGGADLKLPNI
jgi:hypothetical protein